MLYHVYGLAQGRHRPLVEASAQGHMGLVYALLKCKADVDATAQVFWMFRGCM